MVPKAIDTLKVAFVPSRDPETIVTTTEPLKELLKKRLAKEGYDVKTWTSLSEQVLTQ